MDKNWESLTDISLETIIHSKQFSLLARYSSKNTEYIPSCSEFLHGAEHPYVNISILAYAKIE